MTDLVKNLVKRHESWENFMFCNLAISLYESHPIPQKNIVQWDQIRSSVLADCVTSNSMEHCVHLGSCKSGKKKKKNILVGLMTVVEFHSEAGGIQ